VIGGFGAGGLQTLGECPRVFASTSFLTLLCELHEGTSSMSVENFNEDLRLCE